MKNKLLILSIIGLVLSTGCGTKSSEEETTTSNVVKKTDLPVGTYYSYDNNTTEILVFDENEKCLLEVKDKQSKIYLGTCSIAKNEITFSANEEKENDSVSKTSKIINMKLETDGSITMDGKTYSKIDSDNIKGIYFGKSKDSTTYEITIDSEQLGFAKILVTDKNKSKKEYNGTIEKDEDKLYFVSNDVDKIKYEFKIDNNKNIVLINGNENIKLDKK